MRKWNYAGLIAAACFFFAAVVALPYLEEVRVSGTMQEAREIAEDSADAKKRYCHRLRLTWAELTQCNDRFAEVDQILKTILQDTARAPLMECARIAQLSERMYCGDRVQLRIWSMRYDAKFAPQLQEAKRQLRAQVDELRKS